MPRRNNNKRRQHVPDTWKPKGRKRPRAYHHGPDRDEHLLEALRRLADAEKRAA